MAKSVIFRCINDISNLVLPAVIMGATGYLSGRLVKQIDPRANAICFAIAGAAWNLIFHKQTNESSGYLCMVALVVVPYQVCEAMQIPLSFQASLIATAIGSVCYIGGLLLRKQIKDMCDDD